MSALRLAPALLLALAGCVVDTDSLKPKTDADCAYAPGLKACGSRCMPRTPSNGCGNPGCSPCPSAAGNETFCDGIGACAQRTIPPVGYAYCEGPYDTTLEDLRLDSNHCGACGHFCQGTTCAAGECANFTFTAPAGAADLASDGNGNMLVLAVNNPGPGQTTVIRNFDLVLAWSAWSGPSATRLEADPYGFVAWGDGAPAEQILAAGPSGGVPSTIWVPAARVRSLALDPGYAYFVEDAGGGLGERPNDLAAISRTGGTLLGHTFSGETELVAVATEQPDSLQTNVDVAGASGSLRWVSWDGAQEGVHATGIEPPVRLVVYRGFVGPAFALRQYAFWLGSTGNLYRKELPAGPVELLVPPTATLSTFLDLHADANGVYWVDYTPGYQPFVAEWRAAEDDLVRLHTGDPADPPYRVAGNGSLVYWLTVGGAVRAVGR